MSEEKTQLDRIESDVREVKNWINGNSTAGAKVRLDRLEQGEKGRRLLTRGALIGALGAFLTAIFRGM